MRIPRRFSQINSKRAIAILAFKIAVLVALYMFVSVYTLPVYQTVKAFVQERFTPHTKVIVIGNTAITVEVADTYEKRAQGLSGRKQLKEKTGMFFVFDEPQKYGFWMKDMNFAIDIIWFDEYGEIIHILSDVQPETYPETFSPPSAALFVLEVPAGFAKERDMKVGDKIDFY